MADFDQALRVVVHPRLLHRDGRPVCHDAVGVALEDFDVTEDFVPAAHVESRGVLADFVERGEQRTSPRLELTVELGEQLDCIGRQDRPGPLVPRGTCDGDVWRQLVIAIFRFGVGVFDDACVNSVRGFNTRKSCL